MTVAVSLQDKLLWGTSARNPHPKPLGLASLGCPCTCAEAVVCTAGVRSDWDTSVHGPPRTLILVVPLFYSTNLYRMMEKQVGSRRV